MTEKKKSFILYVDRKKELDMLSDEQLGKLFRAIYRYVDTGTEPDFDDLALRILFSVFQSQIDANSEKYKEKCEKNRRIAVEREARKRERMYTTVNERIPENTKSTDTETDTVTDTETDTVTDTVTDTENNKDIYLSGESSPEPPAGDIDLSCKKKSKNKKALQEIIHAYTENDELRNALTGFIEMRNQIKKPLTERALHSSLKKLNQLAVTDTMKIAVVDQSIEHCWQTFYACQDNSQKTNPAQEKPMDDFTALFYQNRKE